MNTSKSLHSISMALASVLIGTAAASWAADRSAFSPAATAIQIASDYVRLTDDILLAALTAKTAIAVDAADVVRLRTAEYDLGSFVRLGVIRRSDLPPLVFVGGTPIQDFWGIPGRIIASRLERAGIDIFDMSWTNAVFTIRSAPTKTAGRVAGFSALAASSTYPATNDFVGQHAYGLHLISQRNFADAAVHFQAAASGVPYGGTTTHQFEFESWVNASYCLVLTGDFPAAKTLMETASKLDARCEMSPRARYLLRIFRINDDVALSPELAAFLTADLNRLVAQKTAQRQRRETEALAAKKRESDEKKARAADKEKKRRDEARRRDEATAAETARLAKIAVKAEAEARVRAEAEAREKDAQLHREQEETRRRAEAAAEAAGLAQQQQRETVVYWARIRNRTNLLVPIRVWNDRDGWQEFRVAPGSTWTFSRPNNGIRICWNTALEPGRYVPREVVLKSFWIVGRPATNSERNNAPASYFNFASNGELGLYLN